MIGCTARAMNDALQPARNEMAEVEWVHRDDILGLIAEVEDDDACELLA